MQKIDYLTLNKEEFDILGYMKYIPVITVTQGSRVDLFSLMVASKLSTLSREH
jgi:hypothetical protein